MLTGSLGGIHGAGTASNKVNILVKLNKNTRCSAGRKNRSDLFLEHFPGKWLDDVVVGADSDLFRPGILTRSQPAFRDESGHRSDLKPAT